MTVQDRASGSETLLVPVHERPALHLTLPSDELDIDVPDLAAPSVAIPRSTAPYQTWSARYVRRVALVDGLIGIGAAFLALTAPHVGFDFATPLTAIIVIAAMIGWPAMIAMTRGYERGTVGVGGDEMRSVLKAGALVILIGAIPSGLFSHVVPLTMIVVSAPAAIAASLSTRLVARKLLHRAQRSGRMLRSTVVVGSAAAAAELVRILDHEPHAGMQVVGVCVPERELSWAAEFNLTVLGTTEGVADLVAEHGIDTVAVTSGYGTRQNFLRELAWSLEGLDVELLVHPGMVEVAGPRLHIRPHVGLPLVHVEQPHFVGWRRVFKRATDLALTGFGLLVLSPVMAGIALAVKLTDGGPVFFRQTRIGKDGQPFTMWKFRSMRADAEELLAALRAENPEMGPMFKLTRDPRITRIGGFIRKFSLDELPQLFNVLGGSMSLVGPRPPLPVEVDDYAVDARRRLLVTPGLTGLWQVSGRSLLSWEETVRLDLRYVENWTLTFDLLILWKTIFAVVLRKGAF